MKGDFTIHLITESLFFIRMKIIGFHPFSEPFDLCPEIPLLPRPLSLPLSRSLCHFPHATEQSRERGREGSMATWSSPIRRLSSLGWSSGVRRSSSSCPRTEVCSISRAPRPPGPQFFPAGISGLILWFGIFVSFGMILLPVVSCVYCFMVRSIPFRLLSVVFPL